MFCFVFCFFFQLEINDQEPSWTLIFWVIAECEIIHRPSYIFWEGPFFVIFYVSDVWYAKIQLYYFQKLRTTKPQIAWKGVSLLFVAPK